MRRRGGAQGCICGAEEERHRVEASLPPHNWKPQSAYDGHKREGHAAVLHVPLRQPRQLGHTRITKDDVYNHWCTIGGSRNGMLLRIAMGVIMAARPSVLWNEFIYGKRHVCVLGVSIGEG